MGTFVNYLDKFSINNNAYNAGVLTVMTRIHKLLTIVIANDNTIAAGAWWPKTPQKIIRAQEIALKLKLPVIYLVDCSGLFLPEQKDTFPGKLGAGKIFKLNSLLSDKGIPQIAGVMGDCIAGGGYMPIISDKVYMTKNAYMVIAGGALIKGSTGLSIKSKYIGNNHIHVLKSYCADYCTPDDTTCLTYIKKEIHCIKHNTVNYYRNNFENSKPIYNMNDLSYILPIDSHKTYNILDIVARILDNSLYGSIMSNFGKEIITGIGRIGGLYVGIIANNQGIFTEYGEKKIGGILYQEGVSKISIFSRICNDDGIPIVWLQDVSGFDIGLKAEKQGLLAYGSNLIYTNSTNKTPMFTVLLRKASGAGYYAMCGAPFDPIIQLATPVSRLSVMEGKTLSLGTFRTIINIKYKQTNQSFIHKTNIINKVTILTQKIEKDMNPYFSANNLNIDELIKINEIRQYLLYFIEASYQLYGARRVKNSRIWSLHDINSLYKYNNMLKITKLKTISNQENKTDNYNIDNIIKAPMDGIFYIKPSPNSNNFVREGQLVNNHIKLGLLEVMKNFYPIYINQNNFTKIKKIFKTNGEIVKKNDILFVLEKKM